MGKKQALEGIKILDFSWHGIGPMSTRYFAHHGAEVIRVESNARIDLQRAGPPFKDNVPGLNRSAYFSNFNSGKYGITLNVAKPKGVELAKRLAARADIVAESFSAGVMQKCGLGYEQLREIKPDIIMISMAMMGQTGPCRQHRGHGMQLAAAAGVYHLTGWPDRLPVGTPSAYTDYWVPQFATVAMLAALEFRRRTGKGQHIDLAQFEAAIHSLETAIIDCSANGHEQIRQGNRLAFHAAAPHGAYRCQGENRWLTIAVFTDDEWQHLCEVMGQPAWTAEPRFATQLERVANADELDGLVEQWTSQHEAESLMATLQNAGVAAGVVQNGRDVHHDPQLRHRRHFWHLEHPEMGTVAYDSPSFKLSKTPCAVTKPGNCIGEHNDFVYTEILGLADEELVELMNEGVVF